MAVTPLSQPTSNCLLEDVRYAGGNLGGATTAGEDTGSAQACQTLCQKTTDCVAFGYTIDLDKCWLKDGGYTAVSGGVGKFVAGPKYCSEDQVAQSLSLDAQS